MQRSLASGELTDSLHSRVDLQKYLSGLRTLRNCIVKKSGGGMNRAGTTYVYGYPDTDTDPTSDFGLPIGADTILVPFKAGGSSDSFVLEFGNGFIRFAKNGARVDVETTLDWDAVTAYAIGDLVNYAGVNYYCKAANTNQQPPNATYWYALYGYEYSIPTPYTSTLLGDRGAFSFAQDTDRMIIAHSSLLPYELVRVSDTKWTLTAWPVDSSSPTRYGIPRINAPTSLTHSGGTGADQFWAVCALTEDLEESLPAYKNGAGATSGSPATIGWTASTFQGSDASSRAIKGYNIYKKVGGIYVYYAFEPTTSFVDNASVTQSADDDSPPESRVELNTTAGTFPKKVGVFDSRTLLGNFSFNVQAIYASRVGFRQNFTRRFPSADDDSILFQVKGKEVNGIRHFVDIGDLLIFADSGEWISRGNANGAFTPNPPPNPKQYSANGASGDIWPVVVGSDAVYVQERGSIVRAAGFDNLAGGKDGYRDDDLTDFADHLFEGKTIVAMDYQKTPHSIVWCVRSDGVLLGLTYNRKQEIVAWHRHDTDGLIEDVCCIPEGSEHAVYLIVKRTINGQDFRFMERMANRVYTDIVDAVFLDAALSFDGRNITSETMTLSGGTAWDETEFLTLTCSVDKWDQDEIGNQFWLTGADDIVYRFTVTAVSTAKICTVSATRTIPVAAALRDTATTRWSRAVNELSGLDHLEAKEVCVFADGCVISNPNNLRSGDTAIEVSGGEITLPECHAVIHVGLPYYSDIETLDIDTVNGETMVDKQKLITGLTMRVRKTRGVFVGPKAPSDDTVDPKENLIQLTRREAEDYGTPEEEINGNVDLNILGECNSNGRVFIRQIDPLPMEVLSIAPAGLIPLRTG